MPIANYLTSGTWLSDQPLRPEAEAEVRGGPAGVENSTISKMDQTWCVGRY